MNKTKILGKYITNKFAVVEKIEVLPSSENILEFSLLTNTFSFDKFILLVSICFIHFLYK